MKRRLVFFKRISLGFRRLFAASPGGTSDLINPALWLENVFAGSQATSGEAVNNVTTLGLPAFYACIRSISEDVAKLPLKVYRRLQPRGKEQVPEDSRYSILHDVANPKMTAMSFRETVTGWAAGWGEGFAEIEMMNDLSMIPRYLWPIHPSRVTVKEEGDRLRYFVTMTGGREVEIAQERMIHIRGFGDDGVHGCPPCKVLCETLGLSIALQKFASAYFKNAGVVATTLETAEELTPQARKNLEADWLKERGGAGNALSVKVLESGMTLKQHTVPAEHAQFLQSRQFQVEDIARIFRMPPHKIQHLLRSTFSNIEQQSIEYVTDTLMPWLVRWEQEIKRKLFPNDPDLFAEHLVLGLLRGDAPTRAAYYQTRTFSGSLSPNDVREMENENPVPGGDVYMVQSSMIPLADLGKRPPSAAPPPSDNPSGSPPAQQQQDQQPQDANPMPDDGGSQDPSAPLASNDVETILFPVFMDPALRMVRKETNDAKRAIEKHRGSASRFRQWADEYFDDSYWSLMVDAFKAPAMTAACLRGTPPWTPGLAARRHMESVRLEVEQAFSAGGEERFASEEFERADRLARAILQETKR